MLQDTMEEDPKMPTGRLEEAGQAVGLLGGEQRWPLAVALLLAGSEGGYERVSPCNQVTASFPQRVKAQGDPDLHHPYAQREGGGAGELSPCFHRWMGSQERRLPSCVSAWKLPSLPLSSFV